MTSPEVQKKLRNPHESRKLLEGFVTGEEFKSTELTEIRKFVEDEALWFGPSYDYVDHLFSMKANGHIEIDLDEGIIAFDPSIHILPKKREEFI